ncbi:hypothetical protein [Tenuifilum osseticum]|uniref:hypothetical protein n=1 Tax=Tenuifilum osseticum TaxID=3374723 RepID=UPI0034E3EA4F
MRKQTSLLYSLFQSSEFETILENINNNYPNLKQELFIRNAILESINLKKTTSDSYRAFAEHPRGIKGSRIDLSIVDSDKPSMPFLVELKYQYPYDIITFDYSKTIERDFVHQKAKEKKTDLFVLFMVLWEPIDKNQFDNYWHIDSNLSRYQTKRHDKNGRDWEQILLDNFKSINEGVLLPKITHKISKPYSVEYNIYIFERLEK